MINKIEFICTANNGRSVPAEIFANQYLAETGLDEDYQAISSGNGVTAIKQNTLPIGFKLSIIKKAVAKGLYGSESELVEKTLVDRADEVQETYGKDQATTAAVETFYETARKTFFDHEVHCRHEAMKKRGLDHLIKSDMEQTTAKDDVIAALPMERKAVSAVKGIYDKAGQKEPLVVEGLKKYVTGEDADVVNTFGGTDQEYKNMIVELENLVPKAVDKVILQYEAQKKQQETVNVKPEYAKS
ncbi:hypothetical protein ACFL96_03035 [Thermoproteota archaeon]